MLARPPKNITHRKGAVFLWLQRAENRFRLQIFVDWPILSKYWPLGLVNLTRFASGCRLSQPDLVRKACGLRLEKLGGTSTSKCRVSRSLGCF